MKEAALLRAITSYLRKTYPHAWIEKRRGSPFRRGMPDIEFILCGRVFFFELKTPVGHVSPLQAATLQRLADAGAVTAVVRSIEDVKMILDAPLPATPP